jgi:hypothetical protein
MTKQELKAKQRESRAGYYLAIQEQVNALLDAACEINVETMRENMYSDFWKFADKANQIENGITFLIRDWVKQESNYDLKVWTFDYYEPVQQEQQEEVTA